LIYDSSDWDHHRSVYTLLGEPGKLYEAVLDGAREAIARVDISGHAGLHPRVGVVDVAPIVYLEPGQRGAACAEALVLAEELGRLGVPVYLYGDLAGGRTRAELRRPGGLDGVEPDFGPPSHPTAGATLVAARPPLIAFNLEIEGTIQDARRIAAAIRESGRQGLPGVRAIGLELASRGGVAQVSTNVEDHRATPLAEVLTAVTEHARVTEAELVGLAPAAAFDGWPADVAVRNRRTLEQALES